MVTPMRWLCQSIVGGTSAIVSKESQMKSLITRFVREEEGQDLIEYAMLATLIALAVGVGATALGTSLLGWYNAMAAQVGVWAGMA
jgi:pilus assembly protein Flp/PilA